MPLLNDEQVAQEALDIRTFELWPLYPILPMKFLGEGRDGFDSVGILICDDFEPFKVYAGVTIFQLKPGPIREQLVALGAELLEFPTVETGVRHGWVGD